MSAQGRNSRHTVSRASEIFAGNLREAGQASGRLGAPLDNAVCKFLVSVTQAATGDVKAAGSLPSGETTVGVNISPSTQYDGVVFGRLINVASAGNDLGTTMTVKGLAANGRYQEEIISLTNISNVDSAKGWAQIDSVVMSAASAGNVTISTVEQLTFPYKVATIPQVSAAWLDNAAIASLETKVTVGVDTQTATSGDGAGILDLTGETITADYTVTVDMMVLRTDNDTGLGAVYP